MLRQEARAGAGKVSGRPGEAIVTLISGLESGRWVDCRVGHGRLADGLRCIWVDVEVEVARRV